MNKLFITLIVTLGLNISYASSHTDANIKPISENNIKKMDHKFTKHKAIKRDFRTQKEFKRTQQRKVTHKKTKHKTSKNMRYDTRDYNNGYNYNNNGYYDDYRPVRQRGYRRSNRGWYLAYKYDRAAFYDNKGYDYGYSNRYGYYFEDMFYRYDAYYTYRDRVRGRGLFDHQYYMPANANYYGFCESRTNHKEYNRY